MTYWRALVAIAWALVTLAACAIVFGDGPATVDVYSDLKASRAASAASGE